MYEWAPIVSECALVDAGQVLKPQPQPQPEPIFIGFAPAATVAKLRSIMLDLPSSSTFTCVCGKALVWVCPAPAAAPAPAPAWLTFVAAPAQLARKTVRARTRTDDYKVHFPYVICHLHYELCSGSCSGSCFCLRLRCSFPFLHAALYGEFRLLRSF